MSISHNVNYQIFKTLKKVYLLSLTSSFMKNKFVVSLVLMVIIAVSCTRESTSLDGIFYEVKGPVKTITEIEKMSIYPDQISKNVYYFNKQGELTKAEHFNSNAASVIFDLEYVTHVKQTKDGIRHYYKTESGSDKTSEVFLLEKVSENEIHYTFKIEEKDVEVNRIIYYNRANLPVRSLATGHYGDTKFETKKENFYTNQDVLDYSVTTDLITNETLTAYYKSGTQDHFGNFTSGQFVDENGKNTYTIKRNYTYYK